MNQYKKTKSQILSDEMQAAITETEGIVRVIAGAGTGKTTVLQKRVVHLCESGKAKGENILCVSFTNKAVSEIKERIPKGFYNHPRYRPFVATFHGFCAFYLHRGNMWNFNFSDNFNIIGNMEYESLFEIIADELQIGEKTDIQNSLLLIEARKISDYRHYIELMKDTSCKTIEEHIQHAADLQEKTFYLYLRIQRRNNILDFSDMLCFMLYLLEENSIFREELQQKYHYILVDEFQDISPVEFAIMQILTKGYGNFFCVGDPDQCIYSFRGSRVEFIVKLEEYFPDVPIKTIVLTKNHRSTKNILDTANAIISKNKNRYPKELYTKNDEGNYVYATLSNYIRDEARYIAKDILMAREVQKALNKFCTNRQRRQFQDTAILVRSTWQLGYLKDALNAENIAYIDGSIPLLEHKEVKDLIAWLKFLLFNDDLSLKRIINQPLRGIGRAHWKKIVLYAQQQHSLYYDAFCDLMDQDLNFQSPGILNFRLLIQRLTDEIKEKYPIVAFRAIINDVYSHTDFSTNPYVRYFLNKVELWRNQATDQHNENSLVAFLKDLTMKPESIFSEKTEDDPVQLLTVHRAKGLEFSTVYVAGLNSEIFPSARADSLELQEEERRLMYVACTRAKHSLILSSFIMAYKAYPPSEYLYDLGKIPAVLFNYSLCGYSEYDDDEQ